MPSNLYRAKWTRSLIASTLIASACVLVPGSISAAESPLEVVRSTTNQAMEVLKNPAYQGEEHRQQRLQKMWETVLPKFDTWEIARRSLGVHWDELTEEQQRHFVELFIQLVQESYSHTLDRYTEDAQFFFDRERIEGDFAEVHTRIKSPAQPTPFSVIYRLHREGGTWVVHDVVAENVSLVHNYRTQFYRIMSKSSYEGLVQALEEKLEELKAT